MKLSPPPPSTSALLLLLPLRDRSRPHAWQAKHGRLGFQNPSTPSYNFYRWCPRGLSTPISFVRAPLGRTFSRSTGRRPQRRRPCRSPTPPMRGPRWLTCTSSNPCRDGGAAAGHPTPCRSSIHPLLRRAVTWETVQSCTQLQVLFAMALSQVCQGNSAHLLPHACYNFFSQ
jgi:hypothetical protein